MPLGLSLPLPSRVVLYKFLDIPEYQFPRLANHVVVPVREQLTPGTGSLTPRRDSGVSCFGRRGP